MYRYLSVDIDGLDKESQSNQDSDTARTPSVASCLKLFFQPEDRELKCEKCERGNVATQTMRIISKPRALLVHLKRFKVVERPVSHESKGNHNDHQTPQVEITFQKNRVPVELTNKLSLDDFLASKHQNLYAPSSQYTLRSVVHHIGNTADSGHYTADAVRQHQTIDIESKQGSSSSPSNNDFLTWVSYDDGITSETTLEQVQRSIENQQSAYMLLYTLG